MKATNIFNDTKIAFKLKSNWQLFKIFFLFKCIKNPWINKISTTLTRWLVKINAPITSFLIKKLVFNHFCGGETKKQSIIVINELYKYRVNSVLDYSIEGQSDEKDFDNIYQETLLNIDFAKNNDSIPFIVFKPTGLGKIDIYEKISNKTILNDQDNLAWKLIKKRFEGICDKAFKNNISVLIDAEESWIQNAIDNLSELMMEKYNVKKPIIFNTLQMYRWDRIDYLKESHKRSLSKKYILGCKIVRGAYMEKERLRSKIMGYKDPIQINKEATDADYNKALYYILQNYNTISLFAGTHNELSCMLIHSFINDHNIIKNHSNIWFGQLYGMSDHITFKLSSLGYNVTKYLPYGPLKETIPYLIRRAQENVSVLGQTNRELKLIEQELKRRFNNIFYNK